MLTRARWVIAVSVACVAMAASPAHATDYKLTENRHEDSTHYGIAATVKVPSSAVVEYVKVGSVISHRTDWAALVEAGYNWSGSGSKTGFVVYGEYGGYNELDMPDVTAGSTHRYWVGYDSGLMRYQIWMDDSSTPKHTVNVPSMTSCKCCINSERQGVNPSGGMDNYNCFDVLKHRYADKTWHNWSGSVACNATNDGYYYLKQINTTHYDCVKNSQ